MKSDFFQSFNFDINSSVTSHFSIMKKLWDLKKVLSSLEMEGQWHHHGSDTPTSPWSSLLGYVIIWLTPYSYTVLLRLLFFLFAFPPFFQPTSQLVSQGRGRVGRGRRGGYPGGYPEWASGGYPGPNPSLQIFSPMDILHLWQKGFWGRSTHWSRILKINKNVWL